MVRIERGIEIENGQGASRGFVGILHCSQEASFKVINIALVVHSKFARMSFFPFIYIFYYILVKRKRKQMKMKTHVKLIFIKHLAQNFLHLYPKLVRQVSYLFLNEIRI